MRKPNKWIYSWRRYIKSYVNNPEGEWIYTNTYNYHSTYQKIRKISNTLPYPVKWVEVRKLNPEYKVL